MRQPTHSKLFWPGWLSLCRPLVLCDSCFIYVLEEGELILKASKNPHAEVVDRLKLRIGQGITGWVAENKKPVVYPRNAFQDHAISIVHRIAGGPLRGVSFSAGAVPRKGSWESSMCSIASRTSIQQGRDSAHLDDRLPRGSGNRNGEAGSGEARSSPICPRRASWWSRLCRCCSASWSIDEGEASLADAETQPAEREVDEGNCFRGAAARRACRGFALGGV